MDAYRIYQTTDTSRATICMLFSFQSTRAVEKPNGFQNCHMDKEDSILLITIFRGLEMVQCVAQVLKFSTYVKRNTLFTFLQPLVLFHLNSFCLYIYLLYIYFVFTSFSIDFSCLSSTITSGLASFLHFIIRLVFYFLPYSYFILVCFPLVLYYSF